MQKVFLKITVIFCLLAFPSFSSHLAGSEERIESSGRKRERTEYYDDLAIEFVEHYPEGRDDKKKTRRFLSVVEDPPLSLSSSLDAELFSSVVNPAKRVKYSDSNLDVKSLPLVPTPLSASLDGEYSAFQIPHDLKHIAIIFDGSRRWAKDNNLPPSAGHKRFIEAIPDITADVFNLQIHTLTLWCFSTGNWQREAEEVNNLMQYFEDLFDSLMILAPKYKIKVVHLGRKDRIPNKLSTKIDQCEKKTAGFSDHILNIAIDYGGRDEIIRAFKKVYVAVHSDENITESLISANLDNGSQLYPEPDLIIRTSPNDNRLSGFMAWQSKYSELYLTDSYAPEFTTMTLLAAIVDYKTRIRTFSR